MAGLRTETNREIARKVKWGAGPEAIDLTSVPRPRTRGECKLGVRPCPWASCRYHLGLSISHHGAIKHHLKDGPGFQHTCALDVADEGGMDAETMTEMLGITREAVRQQMVSAMKKFRDAMVAQNFTSQTVTDAEIMESSRTFNVQEKRIPKAAKTSRYALPDRPRYIRAREIVTTLKLKKGISLWLTRMAPLWLESAP